MRATGKASKALKEQEAEDSLARYIEEAELQVELMLLLRALPADESHIIRGEN